MQPFLKSIRSTILVFCFYFLITATPTPAEVLDAVDNIKFVPVPGNAPTYSGGTLSRISAPIHMSWGPYTFGNTTAPDMVLNSWSGGIAPSACHFTSLSCVNNYHAATCTTAPTFNVFNGTTASLGTALTCSTSVQSTPGSWSSQAQTLAITSGNVYGIELSTAGGTCPTDVFTVQADIACP